MKTSSFLPAVLALALMTTAAPAPAHAADDATVAHMQAQIDALEKELHELKTEQKKLAAAQESGTQKTAQVSAADAAAVNPAAGGVGAPPIKVGNSGSDKSGAHAEPDPAAVTVKLDNTGLSVKNADNDTLLRVHGFVQADDRVFFADNDKNGNDSFELRRARVIIEGGAHGFFYNVTPDFGGAGVVLMDGFVGYKYKDVFAAQVGKMKPPLGLDQYKSTPDVTFIENSLPALLMPIRDSGLLLTSNINDAYFERKLTVQAGVFNNVPDNTNDNADHDDGKEGLVRVMTEPVDGVGIGAAGTIGSTQGTAATSLLPSYTTAGRLTFFSYAAHSFADGRNWRMAPQAYVYKGPFSLLADYAVSAEAVRNGVNSDTLDNKSWSVETGWVLTGENATYKSVIPDHPFDPATDQWGAWQLSGRYSRLDIDGRAFPIYASAAASASSANNWGVVLNGYLTANARLLFSYEQTSFDGGKAGGQDRETEKALLSRAQYQF